MALAHSFSSQTVNNLRQRTEELAHLMRTTAEELQQGNSSGLTHLMNEIQAVQSQTGDLMQQLGDHPLLAESERDSQNLQELMTACQQIESRQSALDSLKRLQLVKSFDQNDQEAFAQMLAMVNEKIEQLSTGSVEERQQAVQAVNGEDSAYRGLYELINRPEELSDERWMENQRLISETFGRKVALAVLRGRAR